MKKVWSTFPIILVAALIYGSGDSPPELSTVKVTQQETSFGDLTADALCKAANVTIGLVPAVAFKEGTISTSELTAEQIASLLQAPEETWAVSQLTGAQIRAALERSLSRLPRPNTAFLQVSGLKVVYNPQAPRGARITSLTTTKGTKGPVDDTKEYQVAMPLSLAKGGSGYFQIFDEDDIVRRGTTGLAPVIIDYLSTPVTINYTGKGRIVAATPQ